MKSYFEDRRYGKVVIKYKKPNISTQFIINVRSINCLKRWVFKEHLKMASDEMFSVAGETRSFHTSGNVASIYYSFIHFL